MTVLTAYEPLLYSGNGATQSFDVTWPFFTGSLVVTRIVSGVETELTINVDYTVTGGTDGEGKPGLGSVIFGTAPASGTQIRIERDTPLTQGSTWDESDNFPQAVVESGLDKSILIAQEIAGKDWSGPKGDQGDVGPANTLSIGTVTKGDDADASITGAAPSQILNLVLPKGDQGEPGLKPVQVDELSDRDAYDDEDEGFSVLVSDVGDGRAAIYSKNSNASADWSDPAYVTGPSGASDAQDVAYDPTDSGLSATDVQGAVDELGERNTVIDFAINLLPDSGRFGGNAAKGHTLSSYTFPSYLTLYNNTTQSNLGKYISNNNDYGGSAGTLNANIKDLIDKIRDPAWRRYGVEFYVAELTMGNGTQTSPINIEGTNFYYSLFQAFRPRAPSMTFSCYIRALDARVAMQLYPSDRLFKEGVEVFNHMAIDPADGWVHTLCWSEHNPRVTLGYNPPPGLNMFARDGHRYLLACPALMGGVTRVNRDSGVIAGANLWLP